MSIYTQNKRLDGSSTIGAIILFAGPKAPSGWVECDGRILQSRNTDGTPTEYSALFGVIGTKYGEGAAIGSFKVPDMSERFAEGSKDSTTTGVKLEDGLPDHNHTFTGSTSAASGIPTGTGYNTSGNHTHERGTWEITGSIKCQFGNKSGSWINYVFNDECDGVFSRSTTSVATFKNGTVSYSNASFPMRLTFNAPSSWTGSTNDPGNHSHSVTASGTISSTSGDVYGGSIVQPKAIVLRYIIKYK